MSRDELPLVLLDCGKRLLEFGVGANSKGKGLIQAYGTGVGLDLRLQPGEFLDEHGRVGRGRDGFEVRIWTWNRKC